MLRIFPKILRVSGQSMQPDYNDGDYIVISPWFIQWFTKEGKDIVFMHDKLGHLVKRVMRVDKLNKTVSVYGTGPESTTGEEIGNIPFKNIFGLVIFHLKM